MTVTICLGLQKHSADARASSFIKILELVPLMHQPPSILFIENVVGFEVKLIYNQRKSLFFLKYYFLCCFLMQSSDTHDQLIHILSKCCFTVQEFILSPLQFGIPYSRPRYFCLVLFSSLSLSYGDTHFGKC